MKNISHMMLYCRDQNEARDFYVDKLGFELTSDTPFGQDFNWLTVALPGRPETNVCLMPPHAGNPPAVQEKVAEVLALGGMMGGILETDDCRRDYEMLRERGVEFSEEPEDRFYGIDCRLPGPVGQPLAADPAPRRPARAAGPRSGYVSSACEKASASNGRRSSSDSPIPISLTGILSSLAMARAMPPFAVPSSLVSTMPVTSTASPKSLA